MPPRPWHTFYDDGVPPAVALEAATLVDFLAQSAERFGERTALIFLNSRLTYRELKDAVDRMATALAALGVTRGTRVAIQLPNTPQYVIAYYATLSLGAVAVPTNPLYTAPEIEHQWNDAGCTVAIVADFIYAQRIHQIEHRLSARTFVVASIPEFLRFPLNLLAALKLRFQKPPLVASVDDAPHRHRFRALMEKTAPAAPVASLTPDDLATLLYTGGTTGVSKGAMLTHGNLSANVQQLAAWFPDAIEGREVFLGALPFFHSFGLTVAMNLAVRTGAAVVLMPNPRDVAGIVRNIERHHVTLAAMVPAHFQAIVEQPGIERRDLSSVKYCISGSAPLPIDVMGRFEQLTGSHVSEGYGLTEASPVTHTNPLEKMRKPGSIGVPLPNTDTRIVDAETGTGDLPTGEVGELVIRGPQVMSGYWQRDDETAQQLRDTWLFTGDLCRVDEDGFHFIAGRKKDMILCSGYNVYPDEVDHVLVSHDAVLEAATIGVPEERRGETVKSFVVLKPGRGVGAEELMAYCRQRLAPFKVPRTIEFRDSLPKSSVLKILRRELRAEELAKRGAV